MFLPQIFEDVCVKQSEVNDLKKANVWQLLNICWSRLSCIWLYFTHPSKPYLRLDVDKEYSR